MVDQEDGRHQRKPTRWWRGTRLTPRPSPPPFDPEMKMKLNILLLGLATGLLCSGCSTPRTASNIERHWSGWYLWTWQNDAGEWLCAFRPGTNWLPTEEAVKAEAVSLNELKPMIYKLHSGESVYWHGLYKAPPIDIRKRIAQMCEARGVILEQ